MLSFLIGMLVIISFITVIIIVGFVAYIIENKTIYGAKRDDLLISGFLYTVALLFCSILIGAIYFIGELFLIVMKWK